MKLDIKVVNDGYALFLSPDAGDEIKAVHFPYTFPIYCYPDTGPEPKSAERISDDRINAIARDYELIKQNYKKVSQKISIDLDPYKIPNPKATKKGK